MNYRFMKKPVIIEAFQMTVLRRWDNKDWPGWLHIAWNKGAQEGGLWIDPHDENRTRLVCGTLEGIHKIDFDDWIIQGIKKEIYPCKPDIFSLTYTDQIST